METNVNAKLKLKVEELRIDQFQVQPAFVAPEQGTVRGFMSTPDGCSGRPGFCLPMPITYSCNETECR